MMKAELRSGTERTVLKIKQIDRPFVIRYLRGHRALFDAATTLDFARDKISARFSKWHNRGEVAEIYNNGTLLERFDGAASKRTNDR